MAQAIGQRQDGSFIYAKSSTIPASSATLKTASNYMGRQEGGAGYAPKGTIPASSATLPSAANYMGVQEQSYQQPSGGGNGGGSAPTGPVQAYGQTFETPDLLAQYETQQRNSINDQYGTYFANLDRQLGLLPQEQATMESQVSNLYGGQQSSLQSGFETGQADLNRSEGKVRENQASTLKDLASNLRNQLQAGNIYLGTRGASDSSARDMLSYALTKVGSQNRSNIQRGVNSSLADIDLARNKLQTTYTDQINQLNTWKNDKLLEISNFIRNKQSELQTAVSQGQMSKQQALQELNTNIYNQAAAELSRIDSQTTNMQNLLSQWVASRAESLPQLISGLQQAGSFNYQGVNPALAQINAQYSSSGGVQAPSMTGLSMYGRKDNSII